MSYFIWVIGSLLLWEVFIRERFNANVKPLIKRILTKTYTALKETVSRLKATAYKKLWHDPTTKLLIKLEDWLK